MGPQAVQARLAPLLGATAPAEIKARRLPLKMEVNKRVGQIAASAQKAYDVVRCASCIPSLLRRLDHGFARV
jgi:hypothetical protein